MFHLAVVLKERNVVDRRLDTQHTAEFVIDLHAGRSHAVFDAAPFNSRAQTRANLLGQLRGDLLAQKARYLGRIGGQHRLAADAVIQRGQYLSAFEHQVCGVLDLANAPVVAARKYVEYRTKISRHSDRVFGATSPG